MVGRQDTRRRGLARRRATHVPEGTGPSPFDSIVEQLVDDRAWRRRVRRVRVGHWCSCALSWTLHCFAEVGWWFTYVPPQRCTHPIAPRTQR